MVQLLLGLPDVDKCRTDIWGLTPALKAQRRGLHEINWLLNGKGENVEPGVESRAESSVGPRSTEQKALYSAMFA
jgi:hypothetical protein